MLGDLGKFKELEVTRRSPHGVYLNLNDTEVLLPNKYSDGLEAGDKVDVFLYKDSEDRPVATTEIPLLSIGEIRPLEVVQKVPFGVFVDMGLEKHLLVPTTEMLNDMEVGNRYLIRLMLDYRTERLIGVARIDTFSEVPETLELNQKLAGYVYQKTDLGFKIWTDLNFIGLLYHSQIFKPITIGDKIDCYVDEIRDDGKIDLRLKEGGVASIDKDASFLLSFLEKHEGFTELNDKSSPDLINETLGMSKKAFKKAVGNLYKHKLIRLESNGIYLQNQE